MCAYRCIGIGVCGFTVYVYVDKRVRGCKCPRPKIRNKQKKIQERVNLKT